MEPGRKCPVGAARIRRKMTVVRGEGEPRHRAPVGAGRSARAWGRAGFALASVAVVAVTGVGWWGVHRVTDGITVSRALDALGADAPRSGKGAMNVLLMGLDSRKDQNGNDLPEDLLNKLHAGDSDAGGYNTNTLILVHIAADDQVTAFSIPRDDYVTVDGIVPGYTHIKIKEAYGLTKPIPSKASSTRASPIRERWRARASKQAGRRLSRWCRTSPECRSITSPKSTWRASTIWRQVWVGFRYASTRRCPTTTPAPTSRRATRRWMPSKPWNSSASATASTTATSTAPTVSRRSWYR